MDNTAVNPEQGEPAVRRRGDKHRQAIMGAVRELLQEKPFAELSVSTISLRAGVARSGFYFYFDSKYSVLAQIMAEAAEELEELTQYFAPRQPGESPEQFAKRMVGSAAAVYAHNDPVMAACNVARHTDIEIREILDRQFEVVLDQIVGIVEAEMKAATAHPISDDVPTLVRTLAGATALVLTGDPILAGRDHSLDRRVRVLEQLWLHALWGAAALGTPRHRGTPRIVTTMAQTGRFFEGKRCFVTGAASGIGRATALRLAAQGAELYLTDRDSAGLALTVADARALGAQVPEHRVLDVSDYDEVAAFAADIHANHPSMDVVMNIAGISAWGTVDQLTHEHWSKIVAINLMGPIHVIETFLPPMVAAGRGGQLVNVSSAAGLVALPWHAAYSASKYGLRGLSEVLRFDLARHRIGVSVVVPGAVKTPLVHTVEIAGVDREDAQGQPLGRPLQRARRVTGAGGRKDPGGGRQEQVPDLHVARHPGPVRVQAAGVVALQRGDAPGQRVLHARASARPGATRAPVAPRVAGPAGPTRTGPGSAGPPRL